MINPSGSLKMKFRTVQSKEDAPARLTQEPVYYADYIRLDKILTSQHLLSEAAGNPAHDEMLFIVVHQTYELWFKQILFELKDILSIMKSKDS